MGVLNVFIRQISYGREKDVTRQGRPRDRGTATRGRRRKTPGLEGGTGRDSRVQRKMEPSEEERERGKPAVRKSRTPSVSDYGAAGENGPEEWGNN